MRRRFVRPILAITLLGIAGGCDDSDGLLGGGSAIDVTVGSGATPTYTWTGADVFSVTVVRTSDPTTFVWGMLTPGKDGIPSPVVHGTVPTGAIVTANAEPRLATGVRYRVRVERLNGIDAGATSFTP